MKGSDVIQIKFSCPRSRMEEGNARLLNYKTDKTNLMSETSHSRSRRLRQLTYCS